MSLSPDLSTQHLTYLAREAHACQERFRTTTAGSPDNTRTIDSAFVVRHAGPVAGKSYFPIALDARPPWRVFFYGNAVTIHLRGRNGD